jgi:hypothetical protein
MATARRQIGYVSTLITESVPLMSYGTATGGTSSSITVSGVNYTLLTFTSSSTLTVTKEGLFDVIVCGGGAGGGRGLDANNRGGGGGAGGIMEETVYLDANQTVTIGAGAAQNTPGTGSSVGGLRGIATAGGGHGAYEPDFQSGAGASGGGGSRGNATTGGASFNNAVSGHAGGAGSGGTPNGGGGGGGAGAAGSAASGTTGGAGGTGYDVSAFIAGSSLFKCGGGGGGGTTGGAGGSSVGGAGGSGTVGGSAAANTASGGGGGGSSSNGGSGGSGIVYVRFKV